ncbi:MAG TPA: sulfatase-like hydrolase/transferase [Candidatus Eisenbacteria bacterium]|nr:sulfatase-like hydrolase/transferase [Candidatus Eisenbacteria bacterium]
MAPCARRLWAALALFAVMGPLAAPADAKAPVVWARKRLSPFCEPPYLFYSSQHVAGRPPCCATIEGVCAGGAACPVNGQCADGKACVPGPVTDRPNIIFFISDDQGYCHYGNAGECRSAQTGTPVPTPKTPTVDILEAHGTVFPIAHNTASWCFPSLATILTGRYQRSFHGQNKINEATFSTVPSALRGLTGAVGTVNDPFNTGNKIGGYCTLLAGKFTGSLDETSFDAVAKTGGRSLGRNECVAGAPGQPPACGTSIASPYSPFVVGRQTDVFNFLDMLTYEQPGAPGQFSMQHFYMWYAPRVPHQPLRSPQPVIDYLFGGLGSFPRGGVMNLGQWCTGQTCAPVVSAFNETNFGTVHQFFGNIWWADDNVRELRKFLAMETAPHCFASNRRSRFDIATQSQCETLGGTWGGIAPDLTRNTIFMYFSDNGWHLPSSKHAFTENGHRTRLIVFDPRDLPTIPSWDPAQETPQPPAYVSPALAHTVDLLPTALGFALGTPGGNACPVGPDGFACDGHDLRPYFGDAPGGPGAPESLRHSLCGHQTKRTTVPTRNRYLLTRPGAVGRCTKATNAACTTSAECQPGEFCLGGQCAPNVGEVACSTFTPCPAGAACLGGVCRMGPACIDDNDCAGLVGAGYVCAGKSEKWCRNAPNVQCGTSDDCPVCPSVNGNPVPCKRLCEARMLKTYISPGAVASAQLTDLFIDPDETDLHAGNPTSLITQISSMTGPYAGAIRKMNCCIDDWWPDVVAESGTLCTTGYSCPADLVCDH